MTKVVTNSERSAGACPQRWLLTHGLRLRTMKRTRTLDLGSLGHEGLDGYFGKPADGQQTIRVAFDDALRAIDALHAKEVEQAKQAAQVNALNPEEYIAPSGLEGLAEDAEKAKILIAGYHRHWRNDQMVLLHNEQTITMPIITPSGRPSPRTRYGGKIDKVVSYKGRNLIMEHKFTTVPLGEWVERHRRSPQVRGYALLLRSQGIHVDGVIYDLINSKPPRNWDDLPVLKDGKRLSKTNGLPWVTAEDFLIAVQNVGLQSRGETGTLADADWYQETYDRLAQRDADGFWYRREVELFSPHEIDRIEAELYHHATTIRRWDDRVGPWTERVQQADPADVPQVVEQALAAVGHEFPRVSSQCWLFNRICPYAQLCASHSAYDVHGLRVERSSGGHAELELDAEEKAAAEKGSE
jgi:hypothetical protein